MQPSSSNARSSRIRQAPPALPHDITVVDNASTDDGIARVRARWTDVQILELPENLGFAAGNNAGIRATRGELILLLNSDTVVPAGAIDTLADRLKAIRTLPSRDPGWWTHPAAPNCRSGR